MKRKLIAVILGLLIVAVGIGLLGNGLFDWSFSLFFPGWWALALAILCLILAIDNGFEPWNILGICIFSFLFARYYVAALEKINLWASLGGAVVIYAGVQIIMDALRGKKTVTFINGTAKKEAKTDDTIVIEVSGEDKTGNNENK